MTLTLDRPTPAVLTNEADQFVVTVTLDDIRAGVPHSPLSCALAQAASRELDSDSQFCQMDGAGLLHVFTSPRVLSYPPRVDVFFNPEAIGWVRRYDSGEQVEPERFIFKRQPLRRTSVTP